MATTDANPPLPEFRDDYILQQVDAALGATAASSKVILELKSNAKKRIKDTLPSQCHEPSAGRGRVVIATSKCVQLIPT